jgi:hypothetical protein
MSLAATALSDQLPLFQLRDFDILLNQSWPVGVDSNYPSELRVRLTAASLSHQMGNNSVDHVVKRYLSDLTYDVTPHDRLDKRIAAGLKQQLIQLDETLVELAPEASVLGQMVSKWALMRVPFSFDFAITCAQRGALFECLAIVRMILEQVAWSFDVRHLDDFDDITSREATQSIRVIRSIHPAAGLFYGWLSDHAHWSYDAHIKAFEPGAGTIGMRLANPLYKAQALAAILVLFAITHAAYLRIFEALGSTSHAQDIGAIDANSLIRELQTLASDDKDIRRLAAMIKPTHGES